MEKLRVLIVDDSIVYRRILTTAVEATGFATALQTASNGLLALERLQQEMYDVVLLDVNMPELDGIQTLERIKLSYPRMAVIMISSISRENAEITLRALEAGAIDFIVKPLEDDYDRNLKFVSEHLKVLFAQIQVNRYAHHPETVKVVQPAPTPRVAEKPKAKTRLTGVDLVVIASSTGGPVALEELCAGFERGFSKPVLIVQHMPPDFTRVLAQTLERKSELKVIEGQAGDIVRAGQVIVAPGGFHMTLRQGEYTNRIVHLDQTELVHGVRPSADVLFRSVAELYKGSRIVAVILTGMGNDGAAGVAELKAKTSCYCISQDEASCVVYGMPRTVVESGLSDEVLGIDRMAGRIQEIARNGS